MPRPRPMIPMTAVRCRSPSSLGPAAAAWGGRHHDCGSRSPHAASASAGPGRPGPALASVTADSLAAHWLPRSDSDIHGGDSDLPRALCRLAVHSCFGKALGPPAWAAQAAPGRPPLAALAAAAAARGAAGRQLARRSCAGECGANGRGGPRGPGGGPRPAGGPRVLTLRAGVDSTRPRLPDGRSDTLSSRRGGPRGGVRGHTPGRAHALCAGSLAGREVQGR